MKSADDVKAMANIFTKVLTAEQIGNLEYHRLKKTPICCGADADEYALMYGKTPGG